MAKQKNRIQKIANCNTVPEAPSLRMEAEWAIDTLERAEKIKSDRKLMREIKKVAVEKAARYQALAKPTKGRK